MFPSGNNASRFTYSVISLMRAVMSAALPAENRQSITLAV
jgi:hypothetical protein